MYTRLIMTGNNATKCCSRFLVGRRAISHSNSDRGIKKYGKIPKVELHRHLEGSVRLSTVLDLAKEHSIQLPHGTEGEMTDSSLLTLEGLRPNIQTLTPFSNLATLLAIFDHTQSCFKTVESQYRIAKEAVYDAYEEGIVALELRYAPSFVSVGHNHAFGDVLGAIESGIRDAVNDLEERHGKRMGVGLLCIGVGAMGEDEMNRTVDFFLKNQDRFVGFDMAGAETNVAQFESQFRKVRDSGGRITCHASEDRVDGKPENALCAVKLLGAERIGHGIQIVRDEEIMRIIRDHDVMLELSVTSNFLTNAVDTIKSHPARQLWEFGIPMCVNTDDPGIMGIDLNHEYDIWAHDLGFEVRDLEAMNVMALSRSFLPKEVRERVYNDFFNDGHGNLENAAIEARNVQLLGR
jgi:adenosine deaminase